MKNSRIFRRRKYIIKRGLQFRYIGIVFGIALLASIVTGYTVFATGWTLLGEKLARVYPQGRLIYVFRATNMALLRNLLFISPLIFILGLLFSHKIAGPVYRIERSLREIGSGDLSLRVRLRKGDELWDVADAINKLTENVSNGIKAHKESFYKIKDEVAHLSELLKKEPPDKNSINTSVKKIESAIAEIDSSIKHWKISS